MKAGKEAAQIRIIHYSNKHNELHFFNPLTLELNPSAQRCLTRFLTGDFAS
jgi:hypothetical protein